MGKNDHAGGNREVNAPLYTLYVIMQHYVIVIALNIIKHTLCLLDDKCQRKHLAGERRVGVSDSYVGAILNTALGEASL